MSWPRRSDIILCIVCLCIVCLAGLVPLCILAARIPLTVDKIIIERVETEAKHEPEPESEPEPDPKPKPKPGIQPEPEPELPARIYYGRD